MPPNPDRLADLDPYELWRAAAQGHVALDHRFLHAILDEPARSIEGMLRFAAEDHEADRVPLLHDVVAILRVHPVPEALPVLMELVELVEQEGDDLPEDLVDAIVRQGSAAVEPLVALYRGATHRLKEAPFLLASLGVRDERVRAVLEEVLEHDPAEGAFCIGVHGDPACRPVLEAALACLDDSVPGADYSRRSIEDALGMLDRPVPPSVLEPFDIWTDYPERDEPPLWVLPEAEQLEFLASPWAEHRRAAAAGFTQKDELSDEVIDRLLETGRGDSDPGVRGACWRALADAAERDDVAAAMRVRLQLAQESTTEERMGLVVGLARHAGEEPVRQLIESLYLDPRSRAAALEAMRRSLNRAFAPYFPRHLDDADPEVRREAVIGVGDFAIYTESHRLEGLFDDEDLRAEALSSYALSTPFDTSRARVRQLLNRIEERAGGLSEQEEHAVKEALDLRLAMHGLMPVFFPEAEEEETAEPAPSQRKTGRNEPCPCGSGKKYKKCCGR